METRARYALIGLFMLAVIMASFAFVYWLENKGGLGQRDHLSRSLPELDFRPAGGLGGAVQWHPRRRGDRSWLDTEHPEQALATIGSRARHAGPRRHGSRHPVPRADGRRRGDAYRRQCRIARRDGKRGRAAGQLVAEPGATEDWTGLGRTVLRKLDTILSDNADNLHSAIANFNTFTDVLAKNSDRIEGLLGGIERMTGGGTPRPIYRSTISPRQKISRPLAETPSWQLVVPEPTALLAVNSDKIKLTGRRPRPRPPTSPMRDGPTMLRSCCKRRSSRALRMPATRNR